LNSVGKPSRSNLVGCATKTCLHQHGHRCFRYTSDDLTSQAQGKQVLQPYRHVCNSLTFRLVKKPPRQRRSSTPMFVYTYISNARRKIRCSHGRHQTKRNLLYEKSSHVHIKVFQFSTCLLITYRPKQ